MCPEGRYLYVINPLRHVHQRHFVCVCVQGTIVYSVVGVPPAPTFFAVDSLTGSVSVRGNLKTDLSMTYVVRTERWAVASVGSWTGPGPVLRG